MPAEAVATVQGGGVNQGVITAVAGELTHRNLRATASDRMIFVLLSHAQVIFLRLLHLSANSGIQTHRHFQTLDTAVMHHKVLLLVLGPNSTTATRQDPAEVEGKLQGSLPEIT